MSQVSKHVFAGEELEVVTIVDNQGKKWFLANPFARILDYQISHKAIREHVSVENQQEFEKIKTIYSRPSCGPTENHSKHVPQPKSKFINQAGIFELINASKMPKAKEFQKWINAELLPKLCDDGEYSMKKDATRNIQQAMNVVHQVSNDGASASWIDNDKMQILRLKLELSEMKGEMMQQKLEFQERENKYQHVIKDLTRQANMTLTEFGVQGLLARDNIADNDQLRDNLRRVKDRVIPELSERPEKEQYATCYEYEKKGAKRIRVTRNQLAEIERRDKIMEQRRENPTKKILDKRYEWLDGAEKFLQVKCPNPVALWIKIRQLHPYECYGFRFTNRANTEIEFLNEDEIREKYRSDVEMCEKKEKSQEKMIAIFRALNFMDEDDAVMKCLTPSLEAKEKLAQIIRDTNQKIKNEAEPSTIAKRNTSGYSPEDIVRFINNYTFNFNNTFNIYNKVE